MDTMRFFCIVALLCLGSVAGGELFARWKSWYHQKLKPCLRSCPSQLESQFVCGFDRGRQRFAVAASRCALARRNACFDQDFQEVPIENCLAHMKYHEDIRLTALHDVNQTKV